MKKLRQNKGITLIALIITIIVMLILVGVTINVALNGGLFTKASEASEQMQIKAEEEELLSAVVASIGTDGKVGNIVLPAGWSKLADGNYRSPKDNIFKVHPNGKIEYIGKYTGGGNTPVAFTWESVGLTVDTNTEYVSSDGLSLNFSTDGKLTVFSSGMAVLIVDATDSKYITNETIDFKEGTEDILGEKGRIKVEMNGNDIDLKIIYFEEDGITEEEPEVSTCVKVELKTGSVYSNAEVLQALGATGGTYAGTWTKIGTDENGNAKLVSTSAVTYCELGEENNLDKSISDYTNAVSILNASAQEATGIAGARSINVEDICSVIGNDFIGAGNSDYGRVYNYYYNTDEQKVYSKYKMEDGNWSDPYNTGYSSQTFVDDNGNKVVVDSEGDEVTLTDTYYYKDLTSYNLGTLASGYYWLASPCVGCDSDDANFYVRYMGGGIISSSDYLFYSRGYAGNYGDGVRAVVSVKGL